MDPVSASPQPQRDEPPADISEAGSRKKTSPANSSELTGDLQCHDAILGSPHSGRFGAKKRGQGTNSDLGHLQWNAFIDARISGDSSSLLPGAFSDPPPKNMVPHALTGRGVRGGGYFLDSLASPWLWPPSEPRCLRRVLAYGPVWLDGLG